MTEFQDSIDEILNDTFDENHLDHLYKIWHKLDENGGLGSFEAFVAGNFAGALIFLYSSYEGKKMSNLNEKEIEDLTHRILGYHYELKSVVMEYMTRHECLTPIR